MTQHNLRSIKQKFKERGVFYTPPELAELLKTYAPKNIHEVYDPTCGDGGLLGVFGDNISKYGQEIDPEQLEVAKSNLVNFTGYAGNTLEDDGFAGKQFDLILANPPFSIKWEQQDIYKYNRAGKLPPKSKADYAFLLHILDKLSDGGAAITLNFPGILYRGNSEGVIRRWMVDMNYIDKIVHIPGDTFIDTKISTALIVLKKNRNTTDIVFEDKTLGIEKVVTLKDIQDNDYNLSVSSYIQEEKPEVFVDPTKLEQEARAEMVRRLKADIEMSRMVANIEGWSFDDYIKQLQTVLDEYK